MFNLSPVTATYTPKNNLSRDKLLEVGLKKIKSCLFSLAYNKHISWEVQDEIKSHGFAYDRISDEDIVVKYIPILQFMAEKVIFSTAS